MEDYEAIVLLGNRPTDYGTMTHVLFERCHNCVKTYMERKVPIIVSGGVTVKGCVSEAKLMQAFLVSHGVSEKDVICEEQSLTTKQNAQFTATVVKERGFQKIAILSSPYHIHRSYLNPIKLFRKYVKQCEICAVKDFQAFPEIYLMRGFCNEKRTVLVLCAINTIKNGKARKHNKALQNKYNELAELSITHNVFIIDTTDKQPTSDEKEELKEIYGCDSYEVRYE